MRRRYGRAGRWKPIASLVIVAAVASAAEAAGPGTVLWTRRHDPSGGFDSAAAIVAGPDGTTVFVTGSIVLDSRDYWTVAR